MPHTKKNIHNQARGLNGIIVKNWSRIDAKVDKLNYLWVINRFSFYHVKKEALVSSRFTAVTNDECEWYLEIAPNEIEDDFIELFLYLHRISKCQDVFAKYKFYILDSEQKNVHSQESQIRRFKCADNDSGWGFMKFISTNQILDEKFLPNDTLTIYCEVSFSKLESLIKTSGPFNSAELQTHIQKNDLSEDLGQLLKNKDLTDVILSVNGKDYHAHKLILSARSPVFAAMFKHNTKENENNRVDITDIDEKVIEEMLYYMYTGTSEHLEQLADGLWVAADKYCMESLKAKCEDVMLKNLTVENAANTLLLADMNRADELKSRTIDFIVANPTEVMDTETWNSLVPSNPHLINEVLKAVSRQVAVHSVK